MHQATLQQAQGSLKRMAAAASTYKRYNASTLCGLLWGNTKPWSGICNRLSGVASQTVKAQNWSLMSDTCGSTMMFACH